MIHGPHYTGPVSNDAWAPHQQLLEQWYAGWSWAYDGWGYKQRWCLYVLFLM